MFFGSNIKLLRKRRGRTQGDVALTLNLKRSTLSGYENNVAQPSIENLITLSDYFRISIDTLLRIDLGSLFESQLSQIERGFDVYTKGSQLRILATTVNNENIENIELVPEKAKAGYATGFADPEYIKELPVFQLPFLSKEKKYRTFQISGDSMLPVPEGAWVTGEFVVDWSDIKNNEAYIILTIDAGIVFKIVENHIPDLELIKLISLNPIYKPYEITVSEIKEIWRFIHFISPQMPEPRIPNDEVINAIARLNEEMSRLKKQFPS
jgi:transcriptional regulator with XRE-family HTH domain